MRLVRVLAALLVGLFALPVSAQGDSDGDAQGVQYVRFRGPPTGESPKLFLACGRPGQQCCDNYRGSSGGVIGPKHCNAGVGCNQATGLCEAPCGAPGQVCCDGPDTPVAQGGPLWKDSDGVLRPRNPQCSAGTCNLATSRCVGSCGGAAGQACCPPSPTDAEASCIVGGLACQFADSARTAGSCVACGADGQIPCRNGCNERLTPDRAGVCRPCGARNQPACEGRCDRYLRVQRGYCRSCGGCGEPTCFRIYGAGKNVVQDRCQPGYKPLELSGGRAECRPIDPSVSCGSPVGPPVVGKGGGGPSQPPAPSGCECTATSTDPACGAEIGGYCDVNGPRLCRPGLGCTLDATGQGPRRCRAPEAWERPLWNCPMPAKDNCWTKAETKSLSCHLQAEKNK